MSGYETGASVVKRLELNLVDTKLTNRSSKPCKMIDTSSPYGMIRESSESGKERSPDGRESKANCRASSKA